MTSSATVSSTRFAHLDIAHDARVLSPRGWTRLQSEWAAETATHASSGPLLELCCGAGHIGLLAAHLSGRALVAVDADPVACAYARVNAEAADLVGRVEVREARLEAALSAWERYPVVMADPPWLPSTEVARYPEDPVTAVDGGADGLEPARACLRVAREHLTEGGTLVLQLGNHAQADRLSSEESTGWREAGRRDGEDGVVVRLVR